MSLMEMRTTLLFLSYTKHARSTAYMPKDTQFLTANGVECRTRQVETLLVPCYELKVRINFFSETSEVSTTGFNDLHNCIV